MTSVCCNPPLNPTQISKNCKGTCNISSTNNPSSIYQRQKIIQNTVRVRSSLFTMNIGALNVYQKPSSLYQYVNWKQMSDRKIPHIQQTVVPSTKSTKHSYTWHRPGCQSPGGKGVDMKHGSYDRYLARIKGKAPLRRGVIGPILPDEPFNRAFPVYGGKTFKTNIVNGYNCPICLDDNEEKKGDEYIYTSYEQNVFNNNVFRFTVGDFVLVLQDNTSELVGGNVIEVLTNNNYSVQLITTGQIVTANINSLFIQPNYSACNNEQTYTSNVTVDSSVDYERIYL